MRRPRRPAQDLRFTIECLPRHTRVAMLEGVEAGDIIVGAYTDRDGGVCPMLAAHRRGGRTNLASFARAWDRYTHAGKRSRRATEREMQTLRTMLSTSLVHDESVRGEFAEAVAEVKALRARRAAEVEEAARPSAEETAGYGGERGGDASGAGREADRPRRDSGERDRTEELSRHPGWAWLRVFRRYDDYEAALDRLARAEREAQRREVERV